MRPRARARNPRRKPGERAVHNPTRPRSQQPEVHVAEAEATPAAGASRALHRRQHDGDAVDR
eukprot:1818368-Prymnesium_polylepis.1